MILQLNLDLLSVAVIVAANLLLGFAVLSGDPKNATSRLFFALALIMSVWSILNYLTYQVVDFFAALWIERLVLFFAVPMSICFVLFIYTFPSRTWILGKLQTWLVFVLSSVTMLITLTPAVFSGIRLISGVPTPQPTVAPGMGLFALVAIGSIPVGIYVLIRKFLLSKGDVKRQLTYMLVGVAMMFLCIILFDFVAPTVYQNTSFIPLSALFVFPFIALTGYAIYKYHLFNLKVAATAILGILVTVFSFINIIFSHSSSAVILNVTAFIIILIGSIKIVRDTLSLAQTNERLEQLTQELKTANDNQVVLIHFITHQVKGFLTKSRNIFSMALDGDFGQMPEAFIPLAQEGLRSDTQGVTTVQEILNAANVKSGAVTYTMAPFDLDALIKEVIETLKPNADAKKLELSFASDKDSHMFTGDRSQLLNALKNLIDNSIKYTPTGSVAVSLKEDAGKLRFTIQDTGVGITKEDMSKLFTEGGHGTESLKVNVESTGFGLYIVKNIIEAHHGKVWAESEGAGKGSRFVVELPLAKLT